jgi:hypothetical protein
MLIKVGLQYVNKTAAFTRVEQEINTPYVASSFDDFFERLFVWFVWIARSRRKSGDVLFFEPNSGIMRKCLQKLRGARLICR